MSTLESTLRKIDAAYFKAARYVLPELPSRKYMVISVLLTIANVTTGFKYGVATKVASLLH